MARPKKEDEGKARARIVEAFWGMLEDMPYHEITVRALAQRAQVNPNTLYHYFSNIDDLAIRAFEENTLPEIPARLLELLVDDRSSVEREMVDPFETRNFARMLLFIKSESPFLVGIMKKTLRKIWLGHLGLSESDLSLEERVEVEFIFGGVISAMQSVIENDDPKIAVLVVKRPLYQAALRTLARLGEAQGRRTT